MAALDALRSYQYGNASPELAEEIADALESELDRVVDSRDKDLESVVTHLKELDTVMEEIKSRLPFPRVH